MRACEVSMELLFCRLLLLVLVVKGAYSFCVSSSSTNAEQCGLPKVIVKRTSTPSFSVYPQLDVKAICTEITYGLTGTVKNITFRPQLLTPLLGLIKLPSTETQYVVNLTFTRNTPSTCPSAKSINITSTQLVEINLVDNPVLTYIPEYHTMNCSFISKVDPKWIRFERNEQVLGYCAPHLQNYSGGYSIYRSADSAGTCVLEMLQQPRPGVYTCIIEYADTNIGNLASNKAIINGTADGYSETHANATIQDQIELDTILGLMIVILIVSLIILVTVCCTCCRIVGGGYQPLNGGVAGWCDCLHRPQNNN